MFAERPRFLSRFACLLGLAVFLPGFRGEGVTLALIVDASTQEIYFIHSTASGDFGLGNRTISWTGTGFDDGETLALSPGVTTVNGTNNLDAPFSLLTVDVTNSALDVTLTFTNAGTGSVDGENQRLSYASFSFAAKVVLENTAADDRVLPLTVGPLVGDLVVSDNPAIPEPRAGLLLLAAAMLLRLGHRHRSQLSR